MALAKVAALLLSLALFGSSIADAHKDYRHYMPPTYAPVQPSTTPPSPPLVKNSPPPKQPPYKPPTTPPHHPPPYAKPPTPSSPPPSKPPSHAPPPSYNKPPTPSSPPPSKPPSHAPPPSYNKPPTPTPPPSYKHPTHPPKHQRVAVQGVVFCKKCNTTGINTLNGASPLPGARVALKCVNKYFHAKVMGVTDKNGYFFMFAPKGVTFATVKTCKVSLAPRGPKKVACKKPTILNGGLSGAILKLQKTSSALAYSLYTVGPFAYEPYKKCTY